ncbi:LOW QUALITY PROTEIN: DNA repair endonuclease XPF-like [Copidosoma floridanum]|uniref:LOW QUALITY PROTEIN: DNA repair endonuclease XPF-like n=1 Tax=Copidosoma floridanum TaxID=29053 RepID=UPI000C6F6424|nr:LOW QUALITY PROTEIN: DNA repair endonuclease XPF-like [Copidosoma floridanum]
MSKFFIILFVSTYLSSVKGLEHLLHYVIDDVSAGSYKYYSLGYEGLVKIKLTTQFGDADIYVSTKTTKPTYEPDQYCLQSTTCGEDIVYLPEDFKRPVSIGVYGHPSHESSRYTLLVYQVKDVDNNFTEKDSRNDDLQDIYSKMLEYENQIFLEILQEDGLVVAAKGLGLETIFMNVIKAYSDPGQLVLVLNTSDCEQQYIIEHLKKQGVKHLPKVITAQYLSEDRKDTYEDGGVLFITGRILVVDLLKNRVPIEHVSGILVYRAHSILNSYQEAFALRLFRKTNKTGFIKAFTNSALAFTVGFANVEQVMKKLYVKKLYLWPRFHKIVNTSLSKVKPEVYELHVELTSKMINIQTRLLDIMNGTLQELKRLNKYLDLEELTVENAVGKKFLKQLQQQLDPIWNQLCPKSKTLVSDLKDQRYLLTCLMHQHSVSFYATLAKFKIMDYVKNCGGWILLDLFEQLDKSAKERVYSEKDVMKPELDPKWSALTEILSEIGYDINKSKSKAPEKILVLTQDTRTCAQLKNCLTMGAKEYLLYEAMKKLKPTDIKDKKKPNSSNSSEFTESSENTESTENTENNEPEATTEDEKEESESYVLTFSQKPQTDHEESDLNSEDEISPSQRFEEFSQLADLTLSESLPNEPLLIIQSVKKGGDSMSLQQTLEDTLPKYVIMYTPDISAVRQLEVYQNKNPPIALKVYFLLYGGSVEEQVYLTSLRREKEAFDKLVAAKTTMVIPAEQDGKHSEPEPTSTDKANENESTRKGGLQEDQVVPTNKVIVDMREFRSELPSLLHQRDIEIEPVTLLIGDYILSPDICVERKSISDLIGSLTTGRLYNQAVAMSRYYEKPMLLIEFDQNKTFGLHGKYFVSRGMSSTDITNRLILLTMHFPKLKLVWSPSPHATAQLFEELKLGRPQPDGTKAAQIGLDDDTDDKTLMAEKYNCHIQDFVAKLPGIHSKNLRRILDRGQSLDHLISLSMDQLLQIVDNKNDAELLYSALHDNPKAHSSSSNSVKAATSKVKSRGLFYKKK